MSKERFIYSSVCFVHQFQFRKFKHLCMIRNINLHRLWILSDLGTDFHTELNVICHLLACTLNLKSKKLKNKTCSSGKWHMLYYTALEFPSKSWKDKLGQSDDKTYSTSLQREFDMEHDIDPGLG